jgi:hypothetical protein
MVPPSAAVRDRTAADKVVPSAEPKNELADDVPSNMDVDIEAGANQGLLKPAGHDQVDSVLDSIKVAGVIPVEGEPTKRLVFNEATYKRKYALLQI